MEFQPNIYSPIGYSTRSLFDPNQHVLAGKFYGGYGRPRCNPDLWCMFPLGLGADDVSAPLAICPFTEVDVTGNMRYCLDCKLEMWQRDVKIFPRADGSTPALFLLDCGVESRTGSLKEAVLTFSFNKSAGDHPVLAVAKPPSGVEVVAPQEADGKISFVETSHGEDGVPVSFYVGHRTSGAASCCMVNSKCVQVQLKPCQDGQEVNSLSGLIFVCLAQPSWETLIVAVTAHASLSSALGGQQDDARNLIFDNQVVLSLLPGW